MWYKNLSINLKDIFPLKNILILNLSSFDLMVNLIVQNKILNWRFVFTPASSSTMRTLNILYLNSNFLPLQYHFGKVFDIEVWNITWFDDKPPTRPPDFLHDNTLPNISICHAKPLSKCYSTCPQARVPQTPDTTKIIHPLLTTKPKSLDSSFTSTIQ